MTCVVIACTAGSDDIVNTMALVAGGEVRKSRSAGCSTTSTETPIHYLRPGTADFTDAGTAPGGATVAKRVSSIERIQRLERLERERLEEKDRKEERRRQTIAGAEP